MTPFFQVVEANTKDVDKGIARIDPSIMRLLELNSGDIVEIHGRRNTAAKVLPSSPEYRGKQNVQIDGTTRSNAKVRVGEKVEIKKANVAPASKIVLQSIINLEEISNNNDNYILYLLEGRPLVIGDKIRVNMFGTKNYDFIVQKVIPDNIVIVEKKTKIVISDNYTGKAYQGITYEDVGGLKKELRKIREMIELPLKFPEVFFKLGIEPPKGVLLYGPPGTGKTLIAKAVAHETDAFFIHVSGPEIIDKYYGESEARLREVFEKAKSNSPSIIFLDEIDAITPKRDKVTGEVEKRVVAQLLALMDGIESRGQVVVIGATNIPHALDPALRRPGRFDREIALGVPDVEARLEILQIHTRGMPLSKDVNLKHIAKATHGFTGADLEALCKEAAMTCLRDVFRKNDFSMEQLPLDISFSLQVTMNHFLTALKEIEPSATREVFVEIPDVKWDFIGGLKEAKTQLQEAIEWPLKYPKLFLDYNIEPYKGILLYGPPGTGKTMLAKAVAHESEANFILINGPSLLSKWVGDTEKAIRDIFSKAKQASPCIIFFDELDALISKRGHNFESPVSDRIISQFLAEVDGLVELRGVFLLAATNRIDLIDPAVLRPGRFDLVIEIPAPNEQERLEIFKLYTKDKPICKNVSLEKLAEVTHNMTGADIKALCREAVFEALRDMAKLNKKHLTDSAVLLIRQDYFDKAFLRLKKMR